MNTLPVDTVAISPEYLEVANAYLIKPSAEEVAQTLGISLVDVTKILADKTVKSYIHQVFMDVGFNNRYRMRAAIDKIIERKFQDLDEAGVGSNKDILEILALSHKMSMDLVDKELALEKLKTEAANKAAAAAVNVQINNNSNYGNLIEKLLGGDTIA